MFGICLRNAVRKTCVHGVLTVVPAALCALMDLKYSTRTTMDGLIETFLNFICVSAVVLNVCPVAVSVEERLALLAARLPSNFLSAGTSLLSLM